MFEFQTIVNPENQQIDGALVIFRLRRFVIWFDDAHRPHPGLFSDGFKDWNDVRLLHRPPGFDLLMPDSQWISQRVRFRW